MDFGKILSGFGVGDREIECAPLVGGRSGAQVLRLTLADGRRFVLKMIERTDYALARKTIEVQEAARRLGALLPRHIRTNRGGWISRGAMLQEWVPGRPADARIPDVVRRFARALAVLDTALAKLKPDVYFEDDEDPFQLCKNSAQVAERLLPICARDGRFPKGYAELLKQHCAFFEHAGYRSDLGPRRLVNVDPNLENTLFDLEHDAFFFIDLDLELHTLGYALGPALFWWLYPGSTASIDYGIVRSLLSSYREATDLAPSLIGRAALHLLNFSFMELSLPIAFLVNGAPSGIDPLDRIEERLARARLIFEERERLAEEAEAYSDAAPSRR